LLTACLPAFGALCLVAAKHQSHQVGDSCRFLLSFLAASLFIIVVRRSVELANELSQRITIAALSPTLVMVGSWLKLVSDFNPDEPILPFRFQRPPPLLIA
jgi:hypothetical protein